MIYRLAADLITLLHFAFVVFVIFGALLALAMVGFLALAFALAYLPIRHILRPLGALTEGVNRVAAGDRCHPTTAVLFWGQEIPPGNPDDPATGFTLLCLYA